MSMDSFLVSDARTARVWKGGMQHGPPQCRMLKEEGGRSWGGGPPPGYPTLPAPAARSADALSRFSSGGTPAGALQLIHSSAQYVAHLFLDFSEKASDLILSFGQMHVC